MNKNIKLVLVSEVQREVIMEKIDEWTQNGAGEHFSNVKLVAQAAVAEYIANQHGFTLFNSRAVYPLNIHQLVTQEEQK